MPYPLFQHFLVNFISDWTYKHKLSNTQSQIKFNLDTSVEPESKQKQNPDGHFKSNQSMSAIRSTVKIWARSYQKKGLQLSQYNTIQYKIVQLKADKAPLQNSEVLMEAGRHTDSEFKFSVYSKQ